MPETGPYTPSYYPFEGYYLLTRDLATNVVEQVSVLSTDTPPRRIPIEVSQLAVSDDGRYLAFSHYGGLDPRFPDVFSGVYRLDRNTGEVKMVSVDSNGVPFDDLDVFVSDIVSLSADGRFVAFGVLDADADFYDNDIYIYDSQTDSIEKVATGRIAQNSNRFLSADGQILVFKNENLLPGDPPDEDQLYLLNRTTNTTVNISNNPADNPVSPTLTDNGRFVIYRASSGGIGINTDPISHRLMVYDAQNQSLEQVNFDEGGNRVDLYRRVVFGSAGPLYDISEDGQWVLFEGHADEPRSENRTVYLKNRTTGELRRIASPDQVNVNNPPTTLQGNFLYRPLSPTMTGDGSQVVYTNYIANPSEDERSYFLYHYNAANDSEQILNFIEPGQGPRIEAHSGQPSLTSDGSQIAFRSLANISDAAPPSFMAFMRGYLFSVINGSLVETTVDENGGRVEDPNVFASSFEFFTTNSLVSGDGSKVYLNTDLPLHGGSVDDRSFVYDVATMVTEQSGGASDVSEDGRFIITRTVTTVPFQYGIRDLQTQTDTATGKIEANGRISKDGNRVLFIRTGQMHLYEVSSDTTTQLTNGSGSSGSASLDLYADTFRIEISSDGNWAAFASTAPDLIPNDTNNVDDLFIMDLNTRALSRIQGAVQPDGASYEPSLSADGRFLAFTSFATNMVANDTNGLADVFLFDRNSAEIRLLSVGPGGVQGDGYSGEPFISDDGQFIVFSSEASNLTSEGTRRGIRQVYRVANPFLSP